MQPLLNQGTQVGVAKQSLRTQRLLSLTLRLAHPSPTAARMEDEVEAPLQDVPWALFHSDLNIKKMTIKHPLPSVPFDIPIRPKVRFDPGGRPPPRVALQLARDTDAYIVDKIILPLDMFVEPGDSQQRRVYYIIAWPDLKAARPIVDAGKILDYVSHRELEDWEYRDLLRRMEQQEQEEAEAAIAKKEAIAGIDAGGVPGEKNKPGRKPKNARIAQIRPPTPELDSEQEEMLARKKQGPSLSTPQKSRTLQLESELDMLDSEEASVGDADPDIQLQWENELAHGTWGEAEDGAQGPIASPRLNVQVSSSGASSPASRARTRPSRQSSLPQSSSPGKPSPTPRVSQLKPKPKSTSSTPIPLPFQLPLLPERKTPRSHQTSRILSRDTPTLNQQVHSTLQQPLKPLATDHATQSGTPSPHPPAMENSSGFLPANSFTPVGGHFPRPPKRTAEESFESVETPEATPTAAPPKKERKKKQPKPSQPPTTSEVFDGAELMAEDEPEYVVKRLEGDEIVDGVHYYKVRWEGNWPPDQNPTWEPKENIPAGLIKMYQKKKASKEAAQSNKNKTPGQGGKQQRTLEQWARKYNSVSEAFEGKAELEPASSDLGNGTGNSVFDNENDQAGHDVNDYDDDPDGIDKILVVDDSQGRDLEESAADRNRRLGAQIAAQLASFTPGRRAPF